MTKLFIKISKPGQLERPQSFILTWEYTRIMQLVFYESFTRNDMHELRLMFFFHFQNQISWARLKLENTFYSSSEKRQWSISTAGKQYILELPGFARGTLEA